MNLRSPVRDRWPASRRAGPGHRAHRRRPRGWQLLAAGAVLAAGLGAGLGMYLSRPGQAANPVHMYQVPVRPAPGFTLTDQSGHKLALSSLRGKPVALYFMDPRCTDVCPLVAQEFVDADRALGAAASRVEFVGVDVNPGYLARRWLTAFDAEHGLNQLPNWHFLTGTLGQLRQVWQDYSIQVQINPGNGDLSHTTVIDFIGPHGRLRAEAAPYARVRRNGTGYLPSGQLSQWGHSIASELRGLLPNQSGGD